jgi:cytochrome bd ubiquinol oxidase subunit I
MGRYPWIVYNLLRISDGLSKVVTANQILGSIIMFTIVYFMLFILFIYMLHQKIKHGPAGEEHKQLYRQQHTAIKEMTNEPPTH